MEQRITINQLNELSDKGKDNLRRRCEDNNYEWEASGASGELLQMNKPLFSIGEMIEFLDTDLTDLHFSGFMWTVTTGCGCDGKHPSKEYIEDELVDCLWLACKTTLEQ